MLTWEAITAMDEETLNRALEEVAERTWEPVMMAQKRPGYFCSHDGIGTYSTVPHMHTSASWEDCMTLANGAHITRRFEPMHRGEPEGQWQWIYHVYAPDGIDGAAITVPGSADDHAHRLALCRLALWARRQPSAEESRARSEAELAARRQDEGGA